MGVEVVILMKGAPGRLHEAIVREIVAEQGASRVGFPQAMRECDLCLSGVKARGRRVIPDAFTVDPVNRIVVAFEVEIHNRLDEARLLFYAMIKRMAQWRDWSFILMRVDASGERDPHFPIYTYPHHKPRSGW